MATDGTHHSLLLKSLPTLRSIDGESVEGGDDRGDKSGLRNDMFNILFGVKAARKEFLTSLQADLEVC